MPRNRQRRIPRTPADEAERTVEGGEHGELGQFIHSRTSFTDWLAAEGAPWRPFDDRGGLVPLRDASSCTRPTRAELFDKDCERQLIRHLKTVCLWPARDCDRTWRLGDFSRYELQFDVPGRAVLTMQFHLIHRWGFAAVELQERANQAPLIKSRVGEQPFLVAFVGAREQQTVSAADRRRCALAPKAAAFAARARVIGADLQRRSARGRGVMTVHGNGSRTHLRSGEKRQPGRGVAAR